MKLSITNMLSDKISRQQLELVSQRFKKNMQAFKSQIPSIFSFFEKYTEQEYFIFPGTSCEVNILHKATGLTLYPFHPKKYTEAQLAESGVFESILNYENTATALIVCGVGLGYHLEKLLENNSPSVLVIYEPENDLFKASLYTAPWFEVLTYCQTNNIIISIQHGKLATNIEEDLNELQAAFPQIGRLTFFRHLAHDVIDKQLAKLTTIEKLVSSKVNDLHPLLALPNSKPQLSESANSLQEHYDLLERNLVFFDKNYPELQKKMTALMSDKEDLLKTLLLKHLGSELLSLFLNFSTSSLLTELTAILKDPLVYGNCPSKNTKDTPFIELIKNIKNELDNTNVCPPYVNFSEVILLGTLDNIACSNAAENAKKLIVIEQNIGRFLISCCLVPWHEIAKSKEIFWLIDEKATRSELEELYKNSSINLIECYLFQPYYTQGHQKLYQQILETIQSQNGKSNYFEKELRAITRICSNSSRYQYAIHCTQDSQEQPIVLIGNGPSLEYSIEHLKTIRNFIVVISCGTAISTLHNNGILPDIHIELEKEYDTFNRLQLLPKAYLNKITLWASSEIHPQIPILFGDCKLFSLATSKIEKEMYKDSGLQAITLNYSYYTVTNFALNILLQWRCSKVILVGVDFGFLSLDEHHARSSSYFSGKGESIYDYELVHGATFKVEGNTTDSCLTVPAFNVARELMEQALADKNNKSEVINIGIGAKIQGAKTLLSLNQLEINQTNRSDKNGFCKSFAYLPCKEAKITVEETIKQLVQTIPQLISIWEKKSILDSSTEGKLHRISDQRELINNLINLSEQSYQCLDGSIRYFESVFLRYVKLKLENTVLEKMTEHWLYYLKAILLETEKIKE